MNLSDIESKLQNIDINIPGKKVTDPDKNIIPRAHSNTSLSDDDKKIVSEIEKQYNFSKESLLNCYRLLNDCDKKNRADNHKIEKREHETICVSPPWDIPWNEKYIFSFKPSICKLKKLADELKQQFVKEIFYHFNKKYNLKLNPAAINTKDIPLSSEIIIQHISEQTSNFMFENAGFEILLKNFKKHIYPRFQPVLSNNKIKFPSYIYFDNYSHHGGLRLDSYTNSEKYLDLLKTLSWYTRNTMDISTDIKFFPFDVYIDFSVIHPFPNFRNFEGIKFFVNRRMDLVFSDNKTAAGYFSMFQLDYIEQ